MRPMKLTLLTAVVMIAFAANSLLCRAALEGPEIDPAHFTLIRIASGALTLWLICLHKFKQPQVEGTWLGAFMLVLYAAGFSFAYIQLSAGTGALLLFGMVQITMIGWSLLRGETIQIGQWVGFLLAFGGLFYLLLPGVEAPDLISSLFMMVAGIGWGSYSLLGRNKGNPTLKTAGNFIRACPFVFLLLLIPMDRQLSQSGVLLAILSGAMASGLGYALWYGVLPSLRASTAATVQLSVPVIAAGGGFILLGEALTLRYSLASLAILGGISLFIQQGKKP